MSDVFDEKEDLKSVRSFVAFMRSEYQRHLHDSGESGGAFDKDPLTVRIRNQLATHWPGDDVVQQLVSDIAHIMRSNNIKPEDLR